MAKSQEWYAAAYAATEKADAFFPKQIVQIMESEDIAIENMDDWCEQVKLDLPCCFRARIVREL